MHTIALTMGDPAGIGPEITAKTVAKYDGPHRLVIVGNAQAIERGAKACDLPNPIVSIDSFDEVVTAPASGPRPIQVLETHTNDGQDLPEYGRVSAQAGAMAVAAIEVATKAALAGTVDAISTAPINKEAIWASGAKHLGHTEMLGALTESAFSDTMFEVRNNPITPGHNLKIFFSTRHVALTTALQQIRDPEAVFKAIVSSYHHLESYGLDNPRLAVAAINPHGGENGNFGDEEIISIRPAVERAKALGLNIIGPVPSDSVFFLGLENHYDGVLSHFHDQGHIPAKTVDFHGTISITVGLPILRTSVDHGTAFDIAGKNIANYQTMASAVDAALDYAPMVPKILETFKKLKADAEG